MEWRERSPVARFRVDALVSGEVALAEKALAKEIEIAERNDEVFALAELQRLGHLLLLNNRREHGNSALRDAVTRISQATSACGFR
jgi:hypothetical protein